MSAPIWRDGRVGWRCLVRPIAIPEITPARRATLNRPGCWCTCSKEIIRPRCSTASRHRHLSWRAARYWWCLPRWNWCCIRPPRTDHRVTPSLVNQGQKYEKWNNPMVVMIHFLFFSFFQEKVLCRWKTLVGPVNASSKGKRKVKKKWGSLKRDCGSCRLGDKKESCK